MAQLGAGSGTGFPGEVDSSTTEINSPNAGKTVVDADKINDIAAAILAIQAELGVNVAGTLSTLLARLAVETNTDGTHGALTASSLVLAGKLNTVSGTVASAAETAIGAANANLILITGTTQIDNFDELAAGTIKICRFAGILTLTNSATETLNLTTADITTAAGDYAIYVSRGTTKRWDMISYYKATGSPLALTDGIADQDAIGASAVGQGELKSALGGVGTTSGAPGLFTLPGGLYGFYPQIKITTVGGGVVGARITDNLSTIGTTYLTRIYLHASTSPGTTNIGAQQQYIQASPPYDMGDGEVRSFIFFIINKKGDIEAYYSAEDPPWANNGPTNIRPDYVKDGKLYKNITHIDKTKNILADDYLTKRIIEINSDYKNSDMELIPHPFLGNDLKDKTIVLVDPMSNIVERLKCIQNCGDDIDDIFINKLIVSNEKLNRSGPENIMSVSVKLK